MPLLNYTTQVDPAKTLLDVQKLLVKAGAQQVMATYGPDAQPVGLAFTVPTAHGPRSFALPVNAERVQAVLARDKGVERRYKTAEQAQRVAWRIVKDWLAAQLAIIQTEMVTLDQVMLPYMHADASGETTIYELYQQRALGSGEG